LANPDWGGTGRGARAARAARSAPERILHTAESLNFRSERSERRGEEERRAASDDSVVAAENRTVFDLCLLPVETLSAKRSLNGLGLFATS